MAGLLARIFKRSGPDDLGGGRDESEQSEYLLVCPSCGDEYRSGFQRCAACDRELVAATAGSEREGEPQPEESHGARLAEIAADEEVVTIRQGTLAESKRLRLLLAQHGIAALVVSDGTPATGGCCPSSSMLLQIRPDDAVTAHKLLREDYRRLTGLADLQRELETEITTAEQSGEQCCAACGHPLAAGQQECPDCGLCCAPP
ncbi:MAG: hypothetical protein IH612_12355 [Desulfofustis sp.]|nr:hypothetical protein [Desulfofustis sp.]